jgi:hypothetical protein
MPHPSQDFKNNVFINCPFDAEYRPLFDAIVFTIQLTGFRPRSSLEASNAATNRLQKIMNIIGQCKYGIHDLSRIELNTTGLPRFNMPLELGIDLGAEKYGNSRLGTKTLLVLDRTPNRYQQFISDISGQDVYAHRRSVRQAVILVRDWLAIESGRPAIPGGNYVYQRYRTFRSNLPQLSMRLRTTPDQLTFGDFTQLIKIWLEENEA